MRDITKLRGYPHSNVSVTMDLESKIKHCEVGNLPLNLSNKVGDGTSAIIYKFSLRNKDAAIKCFRKELSKIKILKVAIYKLREIIL